MTGNFFVGDSSGIEYRNWFHFYLNSITEPVSSATLRAYNLRDGGPFSGIPNGYSSPDASETWTLFDVTTPAATLNSGFTPAAVAGFTDLGTGTAYGQTTVSSSANGTYVEVTLNAAAISAINAALTTTDQIVIGGALTTLGSAGNEFLFGGSHLGTTAQPGSTTPPQLVLTTGTLNTVPEPSSLVLTAAGLAFAVPRLRRRTTLVGTRLPSPARAKETASDTPPLSRAHHA